jgi:beta-mannanase
MFAATVHKKPDVVLFYQDWTHKLNVTGANALCAAGIVPALTWESWSWADSKDGSPVPTQPAYSPRRIASGSYDSYIRSMAAQVKSVKCPMIMRLDQEANGFWYPWGDATPGMQNTPADYVAMWRHVWTVFEQAGVRNVAWMWSPNYLTAGSTHNNIATLYPGDRYVDMVGIDGYVRDASDDPATLFDQTLTSLATFASAKPWVVAETGVSSKDNQASRTKTLLDSIAANPKLRGVIYFDRKTVSNDWTVTASPGSAQAFSQAIGSSTFGQAPLKNP